MRARCACATRKLRERPQCDPDDDGRSEVLDSEHYPEIVFRSTSAEPMGQGSWRVHGALTLHGQIRPLTVEVSQRDGHYIGNSLLKLTDFGIKPVRIAGGTVRVKDEIRIEFDIQLAR